MSDLVSLKSTVCEYCARYHIMKFEVSEAYDLEASWKSTSFPNADRPGCYTFFDAAGTLLYIGKASCGSTIGIRADTYFKWRDDRLEPTGSSGWTGTANVLHTIPVHEAHQAPSLEEYLIEKLNPPENRTGRKP